MPQTLDELGLKHGTDKASSHHNYLTFYDSFLHSLRDQPIKLLEIGVYQGASLLTWRDYFPNARIVGVDVLVNCLQFESDRISIELADQSNLEHLAEIVAKHGPFDLIVDDGSHMWEHQITSLRALFPFLRSGGHYVVEDLQTNYGDMEATYRGSATQSCMDFLKRWMDLFVGDDLIDIDGLEDPFLRTYGRAIDFMTFHRRACVVRKRIAPTDWRVSLGAPLAPLPADALKVVINAHVGLRGDIFGAKGFVDEGGDRFTIQGIELESELRAVEYRVRFPDGTWSEWVGEGKFAGTRGQSLALAGITVRLTEGLGDRYELAVIGLFVGGAKVVARAGEDCVAPNGANLRGLQLILGPAAAGVPSLLVGEGQGGG